MMLLLILIVTVGFLLLRPSLHDNAQLECKKHAWVARFEDDKTGYLICKKCGKIPGEDQ